MWIKKKSAEEIEQIRKEYKNIPLTKSRKRKSLGAVQDLRKKYKIDAVTLYCYVKPEYYARRLVRQRIHKETNPITVMLVRAKSRAKKKGIEFTITPKDVVKVDVCPILNIPLLYNYSTIKKKHTSKLNNAASIDRIDNDKGYIPGNVQIISHRANAIKKDTTLEELEKVYTFMKNFSGGP